MVQRGFGTRLFFTIGITFGWECDVLIMNKSNIEISRNFTGDITRDGVADGEGFQGVLKSSHSKDEVIKQNDWF